MPYSPVPTASLKFSEARPKLSELLNQVFRREKRILITKDAIPVAAIVSVDDLERLDRMDAERAAALAVFDDIGEAFADQSPEKIGEEVAQAIAQVRAEKSQQREAAVGH